MRAWRITRILCLPALLLAGGCRTEVANCLGVRLFHVSEQRPVAKELGVKLLRVEPDGTVLFQDGTGTQSSKPLERRDGPVAVVESDPAAQTATLAIFGCRRVREQYFGPFLVARSDE